MDKNSASTKRGTIFLVDDNITNLTMGRNVLAKHYNVVTVDSGERMLKMLEKTIPDMILLDIEMPNMNGFDVIKIIKSQKETQNIPVIFLTAKNDCDSELEGLSLGAIDYITKPFSPSLLLRRIETHLLVAHQNHELEAQKSELLNYNDHLQEMVEAKTKRVLELQNATLKAMAELVECRDDITGGHIERTTCYLGALLNAMIKCGLHKEEISKWNIDLVQQSAQLHDVGKISIKDSILRKPGRLTTEEFEEIKKHAVFGGDVIEKIKNKSFEHAFLEHAKIFAETHHEKWDGSGYPKGLKGNEIPLQGRLMAIADVYDALVSDRPYKKAFSHENSVKIIFEGSGTHFEPALVDVFLDISDEFNEIANFLKSGG
jgi:putative two-component system response regulator